MVFSSHQKLCRSRRCSRGQLVISLTLLARTALQTAQQRQPLAPLADVDALVLSEEAAEDRIPRLNANTLLLAERLSQHPAVAGFSPVISTFESRAHQAEAMAAALL